MTIGNLIKPAALYVFWKKLKALLTKFYGPTVKKWMANDFNTFLPDNAWDQDPKLLNPIIRFTDLANAMNSGVINFNTWVYMVIGEFVKTNKLMKEKDATDINKVQNFIKFYTVKATTEQAKDVINTIIASTGDDPFMEFSDSKVDLYKVDEEQKNKLYDLIKNGEVNFYFFIDAWNRNKFTINEKKIADPDYKHFIQLMQIVRQNIKKKEK